MKFHELVYRLHTNGFIGAILRTRPYLLCRALADCESVLDLGCGPNSLIRYCKNVKHSIGVEVFEPYLQASRAAGIHREYIAENVMQVDFPRNSFDAVFLGEVIEHLVEEDGLRLLRRAEAWARKKVVLTTPNGFTRQPAVDGNDFQCHLSGWDVKKLSALGYSLRGIWGLKALMNDYNDGDIFQLVKWRPRYFWFGILALSQIISYHFPKAAFALFAVRQLGQKDADLSRPSVSTLDETTPARIITD